MKPSRILAVLFSLLVLAAPALAQWKPAEGPLKTRWAADVSPEKAHPEYPRPQMVRADWLNLNGLWDYALTAPEEAAMPAAGEGKILVPFPIESALSGVMKRADGKRLWYRRSVQVPQAWAGKRVLLHFGAVDWDSKVFVNGKEVGTHRGGYDPFSFDITDALKPGGTQEIVVSVTDPSDAGPQPCGKQVRRPGGIMYTPTTGIWQTVWLEPVAQGGIRELRITPLSENTVVVSARTDVPQTPDEELEVQALAQGQVVGQIKGKSGANAAIRIDTPRLWSPDDPFLYDLKVTLKKGGQVVDSVTSYFGLRTVKLAKDEKGINRLMLNGKFVFQVGTLDQGFWPDGLYTAPTDEALRWDIEAHKKLGFNMVRKHVKVEPQRWYYWCDKLGLLVWQDMPSGRVGDHKTDKIRPNVPAAAATQHEKELKAMIDTHWNSPSIIMWVVFNEGWGQYDTPRLTNWTKLYDPSRLVNCASGWTDHPVGDVIDMHNYPGPGSPKPTETRAAVLGEYGGLGLPVEGHMWQKENWGYRKFTSADKLTRAYCSLQAKGWALKDDPGCCALVYTQLTDVETETNGLFTYDRAVLKMDEAKIRAANLGQAPTFPEPVITPVAPSSQKDAQTWRFTTEKPVDGWQKPDFDDAAWKQGLGGFGTKNTPGAVVRTEWKTPEIWIRRTFELPAIDANNLSFWIHHDEDAEVYINGVLAAKVGGFTTDYEDLEITRQGRAALKPGKNTIAVHCKQTMGGQYIDVGLVEVK